MRSRYAICSSSNSGAKSPSRLLCSTVREHAHEAEDRPLSVSQTAFANDVQQHADLVEGRHDSSKGIEGTAETVNVSDDDRRDVAATGQGKELVEARPGMTVVVELAHDLESGLGSQALAVCALRLKQSSVRSRIARINRGIHQMALASTR
ncbi:MAG: hypothetical protein ABF476_00530 [Bifidobacterium aquikefiri]